MAMRAKPMPTLAGIKAERARRTYLEMVCQIFPELNGGDEYRANWHHRYFAKKLQEFADPDSGLDRLMIFCPPQHGKSELTSRYLPAWIFGHNPRARVIGCSYGESLALAMSKDAKRVMQTNAYQRIFLDTRLPTTSAAVEWEIVDHLGSYLARGAGQGTDGNPADYLLIDDPLSEQMAKSKSKRESVYEWYSNSLKARLSNKGKVLIVMTRWHLDDLAGRLLDEAEALDGADQWEVIRFPAICEDENNPVDPRKIGEALWPWHKTIEDLESFRAPNPTTFEALFQQNPTPPGGTIVKTDDIRHWERLPGLEGRWAQSWDLRAGGKSKKSSFAVGQLWFSPKSEPANAYLIDQKRGRWDINETLDRMLECSEDRLWSRATEKLVENAADGRAVIPMLQNKVPGIVPVSAAAKGDKEGALQAVAPFFRSGNVFVPPEKAAPWVKDFVHEMTTFPGSANDDQVDACSQALAHLLIPDADDDVLKNWRHW